MSTVMDKKVEDVRVGHIMVDGVVLDVENKDGVVRIEFRNAIYTELVGTQTQILGRAPLDFVRHIIEAERAKGNL